MFVNNNKHPQVIHYDRDINMIITCTYILEVKCLHINIIHQHKNYNKITCL